MAIQYGMSEQTAAVRQTIAALLGRRSGNGTRKKRKRTGVRKSARKATRSRKSSSRRASPKAKFKKGSAAAKRHMAKLRKMVKRR